MKRKLLDTALLFFVASVLAKAVVAAAWYLSLRLPVPHLFGHWLNAVMICSGCTAAAALLLMVIEGAQSQKRSLRLKTP